jgi:hypothetical protein
VIAFDHTNLAPGLRHQGSGRQASQPGTDDGNVKR